jgi:hypothetical protein
MIYCNWWEKEMNKYTRTNKNKIYRKWSDMIRRCYNKKNKDYQYYGERGINVCERWLSFENFVDDMYDSYTSGLTIDRIDNNGNYQKDNCKWSSFKEQCLNRRSTHFIETENGKMSITEFSKIYGIKRNTINSRIRLGHLNLEDLKINKMKRWNEITIKNPETKEEKNISEWEKHFNIPLGLSSKRYSSGIRDFKKLFYKGDLRKEKYYD